MHIFGPNKRASILEGSKVFAKTLMRKHGIPTADFKTFDDLKQAKKHISTCDFPLVIKADGLARGKGVFVCKSLEDADKHIDDIMKEKIFGYAGNKIVIEEFLSGEEVSILAITDGKTIVPLASAQDHKAVYDGNNGSQHWWYGGILASTIDYRGYAIFDRGKYPRAHCPCHEKGESALSRRHLCRINDYQCRPEGA